MSPVLILIRHAKSSWDNPEIDDHDRPLNARGRRSAVAIGAWLAQLRRRPDLVLSSDSERTRETWALVERELGSNAEVNWLGALYHAGAQTMLDILKGAGSAKTVAMLGHNPGIADFANMLARAEPAHPRFHDYPTAATSVFTFEAGDWARVDWGTGKVAEFITPRDLDAD